MTIYLNKKWYQLNFVNMYFYCIFYTITSGIVCGFCNANFIVIFYFYTAKTLLNANNNGFLFEKVEHQASSLLLLTFPLIWKYKSTPYFSLLFTMFLTCLFDKFIAAVSIYKIILFYHTLFELLLWDTCIFLVHVWINCISFYYQQDDLSIITCHSLLFRSLL